ncbi:hypothetical protein ACTWP6_17700 [Mycobacterium sp. 4D054]|uniref:hypothetical protein n=1 Tax=Mycobacterium sp. 4D054 TaxID=3457440 RepID=UPI003FD52DB7
MNSYYIEFRFGMGPQEDRVGFESHLDDVADAFADIPDVDGDVGADLDAGRVDVCVTVNAESRADAIAKALAAARTAIHTAGGHTPGWDGMLGKLLDNDEFALTSAPSDWAGRAVSC